MLLSINENDGRPIYQQLAGRVREKVSKRILKPGDTLPSVRELPNTSFVHYQMNQVSNILCSHLTASGISVSLSL